MNLDINNNTYNQIIDKSLKNEKDLMIDTNKDITPEKQNNFLETTLGKTINGALDIGLRLILPNMIENQIIEIKDELLKNGLKEGIDKSIETAMEFGKSALGIITGKFDNISQIETAVQKGGILDSISNSLDWVLNYTAQKKIISKSVSSMIKNGKNVIIDNIQNNIEKTMTNQVKGIERVDQYIKNWNRYLREENFPKMQKEYEKVKEQLKELIPLENTLKKARELENIHLLIKSKQGNFEISQEEKSLAQKLI